MPHFQEIGCNLVARNRVFLDSIYSFGPHTPLKNFRYAHSAAAIGKMDQGGIIVESSRLQMAIPKELTIRPIKTERKINGTLSQVILILLNTGFCFIMLIL